MDNHQIPRNSHEGFSNNTLFATDGQQQYHHTYDNLFPNAVDQNNFADASSSWPVSNFPSRPQSRGLSGWQPNNANHLSASPVHANVNGGPYARSLSNSPAPFAQNGFAGYGGQPNYPYRAQQYDPALVNPSTSGQEFNPTFATYGNQSQYGGTIAPQALEHEVRQPAPSRSPYDNMNFAANGLGVPRSGQPPTAKAASHNALINAIPKGTTAGNMSIINYDQLSHSTNSSRMGNFVNIGKDVFEFGVNRTIIPVYVTRKSNNELKRLAGNDLNLLAKIGKNSAKKQKMILPTTHSIMAKVSNVSNSTGNPVESIKYEEDDTSSESDSSDDDSAYSSDEDEGSPLPSKRPDSLKGATEYDTIKALWRSKRKNIDSDGLRKGIVDFWDILNTIRNRWKADREAVADAEKKGRTGELPLLQSRVKDQRDMIETAFKVALKYGHKSILDLLGENSSLLYLCYQFLLDRFKEDDANSPLARSILELMAIFTTVPEDRLEKTYLQKLFPKYISKADAKTQFYVKKVMANAIAFTKSQPADAKPSSKPVAAASATAPTKKADARPVVGVKRPAGSAAESAVQKKVATGIGKSNGIAAAPKTNGMVKKTAAAGDGSKSAAIKTKPAVAKSSGFFSSAASKKTTPSTIVKTAAKPVEKKTGSAPQNTAPKSTFSFAETMANIAKPKEPIKPQPKPEKELPPETAEEKAKRLRKEVRRKLHVAFKAGDDLEEVRYFTHDPDEELGHDSSQMRDVSDVGGEGRMLKMQNQMMDVDEDDDAGEDDKLVAFQPPSSVDFSTVPQEERARNFAPYGGGQLQPDTPERAARDKYESTTLMVFYSSPSDIPSNPREPADPYNGLHTSTFKKFDLPDDPKYSARARQRKASQPQSYFKTSAQQPALTLPPAVDLQKILASLQVQQQQPQAPQQQPPMMGFGATFQPQPPMAGGNAPAPQPQLDIAAIIAQITVAQNANNPQAQQQFSHEIPDRARNIREGSAENKRSKAHVPFRTRVCRFWEEGTCNKGDQCTFLHEYPAEYVPDSGS